MKKQLTLLLISLVSGSACQAQFELEHARNLYQLNLAEITTYVTTANGFTAVEIAEWNNIHTFVDNPAAYVVAGANPTAPDIKLVAKILERMSQPAGTKVSNGYVGAMSSSLKNTLNGNIGAQFTSQLIIALSDLIIERAQAELTLQYFTKLRTRFTTPITIQIPNGAGGNQSVSFTLQDLFQNAYNALSALIENNNASVISIGQSFKAAFEEDMKQFYFAANRLFLQPVFNANPNYQYLDACIYSIHEFVRGSHPANVLQNLAYKNPPTAGNHFSIGINFLYVISESFKNETDESVWVSQDAIDGLSAKEILIYFSLLYLNNTALFNQVGINAGTITAQARTYYPIIKRIGTYVNASEKLLDEIKSMASDFREGSATGAEKAKRFFDFSHTAIDLIFLSQESICVGTPAHCTPASPLYRNSAHRVVEIIEAIQKKDYSTGFRKSFQVIEELSTTRIALPPGLTKIALMASDIANADSVSEIKKILDGAILPVGSFRVKRESNFSVHVNAYPGLSAGIEFVDKGGLKNKGAAHISPFVPLGFDLSWGKTKNSKSKSNGIFISLVDLGTVASYRIQNQESDENKAAETPDIKWQQLISPGLFYVHGVKDSPLSWGFGGQLNPSLREITDQNEVKLNKANAIKLSLFLSVDIPLFNLSSR